MRTYSVHELSRLGAATAADLDTLLNSSGLTPAKAERYDEIGDANGVGLYSNRRGSQKRAKKDDSMFLRMMSSMEREVFEFNDDDDRWGRRRPRGRGRVNGPDSRRAVDGDGERKPNAEDGERRPADADAESQRRIDAEGERAVTPEGDRAATPDAERVAAADADRVATPEVEPARVVAETITPDSERVVFADTAPEVETRIGPAEFEAPRAVEVAIEPARTVDPVVRAPVIPTLETPVVVADRTLGAEFRVPATPSVIVEARPVIDLDTIPALRPVEVPVADADIRVGGVDTPVEAARAPATLSPALAGLDADVDLPAYEPARVAAPDFDPSMMEMPEMRAPVVDMSSPNLTPSADTPIVRIDAAPLDTPDIDTRAPDLADFFARSHNGIYVDMDMPEMRAPNFDNLELVTPSVDAETIRASAPDLDIPAAPDAIDIRTASAQRPFESHLESRGTSMDAFRTAVETPAPGRIDIGAAPVDAPHASLNAGRAGRFTRLLMPNGLDYAVIGGFATYAAVQTASIGVGNNADIELASGVGIDLNGAAIGGAAADAAPWVDAIAAKYRGRDAEATVRLIVNGVETATPFAFAAAGAWVGGATGSAGAGVGAIPGAVVGGVGGFVVGLVASGAISVAVDEGLRATARGMGYDVDRGFVSSLLAPEFAGEMEAWVSRVYGENGSLPDGATPQQIVDDILSSTDDPTEQVTRFREFMGIMNESLYSTQEEHLDSIRDIVEAQTGITDLRAVLDADPEVRDNFLSFYQNQLEQDPNNETAQMVMSAVAEYYALQENRFSVQQAILNADIMHAVSMNEDIRDNVEATYQNMHHAFMAINMQEELVPELIEIDAQRRLQELYSFIETQQDDVNADTNSLIQAVAANGGDAYAATGSTEMLTQALTLYDDMETALSAAADRIVTTHMDGYEIFFDNYDRLEGYIDEALDDYADRAPESAAELRRIIADSNGFQNLTDDQRMALAQNVVFREALQDMASEMWILRSNPNADLKDAFWDLEHNLDQSGYGIVMSRLGLVAHQREELETTLRRYGVDAEMTDPELDAGPRRDPRMDPRMVGPR